MRRLAAWLAAIVAAGSLAACANGPASVRPDARDSNIDACRDIYRTLDARVEDAGVADAQAARIPGFPHLRIDRFLAADGVVPDASDSAFDAWIALLRDRDLEARRFEIANLTGRVDAPLLEQLERCSSVLIDADLATAKARARLADVAKVPDDYSYAMRVLGLYPFTSLPFYAGVRDLHEGMREAFSTPLAELPVEGRLVRYRPPPGAASLSADAVAEILAGAAHDPPAAAKLTEADAERLLETFAPIYEIDVAGSDDRIGSPYWTRDGLPDVDVARPAVYTRLAYTRFEGRTLVQLVYSVWFPARPPEGDFDLLSGRLDGITLRVTLGADGRPLIYDSMHNCGCYHLFVPSARLERRPPSEAFEEPLLVPQRLPETQRRIVVRIARRSHYIQRLYADHAEGEDEGAIYAFRDDDALRSLALDGGGRRSLFDPDALVPGTERGERWFFWPMGIPEPGAMRQWGNHATAFVGKRHFDDADLIERYFRRVE